MRAAEPLKRHCERSEAIQPRAKRAKRKARRRRRVQSSFFSAPAGAQLDCFVASLLAMT
jgi:hypothetical protein